MKLKPFFLLAFLGISSFAQATTEKPILFLIPGAASSGDRIYLEGANWAVGLAGGNHYFGKLLHQLKKDGLDAEVCPASEDKDTRTLEERAEECVAQILARRSCTAGAARDVLLFGHSMGGLIARLIAADPRVGSCIRSVTTAGTPHLGTPLSDFASEHAAAGDGWGDIVRSIGMDPSRTRYLPELAVDRDGAPAANFRAQDTPDNPAVHYFSYSESMSWIPIVPLDIMRKIISSELVKRGLDKTPFGDRNDGVVPEYSMLHGTYLGHLPVHHWASACVDPVRVTSECRKALAEIIPHLEALYRQ